MPQSRRRSGVEDRWDEDGSRRRMATQIPCQRLITVGEALARKYVDERWRAAPRALRARPTQKTGLMSSTAAIVSGTHVAPRDAQFTVEQWCDCGSRVTRSTAKARCGQRVRTSTRSSPSSAYAAVSGAPSLVKAWTAKTQLTTAEQSYIYALHSRVPGLTAVHDGVLGRNPCSRRTAPPMGKPKVYVATTEQVWAIHDAVPDHLRVAVLLGAFAGLRVAEGAALRVADVDFIRGVVHPKQQWPDKPLKTDRQRSADTDPAGSRVAPVRIGEDIPDPHDGDQRTRHRSVRAVDHRAGDARRP